jgi:hypothetical protein
MKSLSLLLMLGSMAWGQTRPSPPQDFQVYTVDTGAPHVTFSGPPPTQQPETQPFGEGWSAECVTVNSFLHLITPNYDRADCWPEKQSQHTCDAKAMEMFPEACAEQDARFHQPEPADGVIGCGRLMHEQEHPEETVSCCGFNSGGIVTCTSPETGPQILSPEGVPPDVPAIKVGSYWGFAPSQLSDDGAFIKTLIEQYTCADKTRILMHDEQEPPKYWCHAPIR